MGGMGMDLLDIAKALSPEAREWRRQARLRGWNAPVGRLDRAPVAERAANALRRVDSIAGSAARVSDNMSSAEAVRQAERIRQAAGSAERAVGSVKGFGGPAGRLAGAGAAGAVLAAGAMKGRRVIAGRAAQRAALASRRRGLALVAGGSAVTGAGTGAMIDRVWEKKES